LNEIANNPSTGIRLHVHEHEDETWLILGEEYMFFQVGDRTFQAHPGDHVFGPRGVPHRYANCCASVARALIMVTPADFEGFWRESAQLAKIRRRMRRSAKSMGLGRSDLTVIGRAIAHSFSLEQPRGNLGGRVPLTPFIVD